MSKTFDDAFAVVSLELQKKDVDCLLVGGFAVNYYGYTRNTLDVDFMIAADDMDTVRDTMIKAGFTNVSVTENVVFFSAPDSPLRVDFLRVDRRTIQQLLSNAVDISFRGYHLRIPSLMDLLAMKIFALHHGKTRRTAKDLPDIAYLSVLNNLDPEHDILPLCEKHASHELYLLIQEEIETLRS